jgi:hypothetical protein
MPVARGHSWLTGVIYLLFAHDCGVKFVVVGVRGSGSKNIMYKNVWYRGEDSVGVREGQVPGCPAQP